MNRKCSISRFLLSGREGEKLWQERGEKRGGKIRSLCQATAILKLHLLLSAPQPHARPRLRLSTLTATQDNAPSACGAAKCPVIFRHRWRRAKEPKAQRGQRSTEVGGKKSG